MDTSTTVMAQPGRRSRRRHSDAFKTQVIQACLQPGVSIASVALANGLNANMLRKWVVDFEQGVPAVRPPDRPPPAPAVRPPDRPPPAPAVPLAFVQLPMPAAAAPATAGQPSPGIFIELQRTDTSIYITWPSSEAAACGAWLRELLRP
jgi:transposase